MLIHYFIVGSLFISRKYTMIEYKQTKRQLIFQNPHGNTTNTEKKRRIVIYLIDEQFLSSIPRDCMQKLQKVYQPGPGSYDC